VGEVLSQEMPREGQVIQGRYVIERVLGQGGFAVVYRAFDRSLRRPVALKTIRPEALDFPEMRRRLLREARLASELRHPNTVLVYDSGTLEGPLELPFLVMELLVGRPLGARLRAEGALPPHEVAHVLIEILGSLEEAHQKGVIHRDLKPDNLFLCEGALAGRVKVLDFGVAQAFAGQWGDATMERLTRTGEVAGTIHFMAPEFFNQELAISPAVDIYALGCLAQLMLTGSPPFVGITATDVAIKHIREPAVRLGAPTPPGLAAVIQRCLEKEPRQRYADAAQMRRAVEEAAESIRGTPWVRPAAPPGLSAAALMAPTELVPAAAPPRAVAAPREAAREEVAAPRVAQASRAGGALWLGLVALGVGLFGASLLMLLAVWWWLQGSR
jgi:serine/threonine protein kinase